MNNIKKALLLGTMIAFPCFVGALSQDTWWLAHKKNDSAAQYYLAEAYNPAIFNRNYRCAGDEFYLDAKDRHLAGCKEKSAEKYIEWLSKSAKNHYPLAQTMLGIEYMRGEKVDKNIKQAIYWLEKASGPISKQANYKVGEGTIWLQNNADFKGVGEAQYALATLYDDGKDIKADYNKAISYYEMATRSYDWGKSNKAQYKLYLLYKDKLKDAKKAFYWLNNIASNQHSYIDKQTTKAPKLLIDYFLEGGQIDGSVKEHPNYLAAAKQLLLLSNNSNASGYDRLHANMLLGWFYLKGFGVASSVDIAAEHYIKGAKFFNDSFVFSDFYGNEDQTALVTQVVIPAYKKSLDVDKASEVLSQLFVDQPEKEKRFVEAMIKQSVIEFDSQSFLDMRLPELNDLFLLGKKKETALGYSLLAQSKMVAYLKESDDWETKSVKTQEIADLYYKGLQIYPDNVDMLYGLGLLYDFVAKDMDDAIYYYQQASALASPQASYRLGVLYYLGEGIDKDYKKAWQYLNLAAQHGYQSAKNFVFSINLTDADADWLKQQYIDHEQIFPSPVLVVDDKDWLERAFNLTPTNKLNYHRLKYKYEKYSSSDKDLCEAAIAYASEGNKVLQREFVSKFGIERYKFFCQPDPKLMNLWIEQSDYAQSYKEYFSALYVSNENIKKTMQKLADAGNDHAMYYLSNELVWEKTKKARTLGMNYAKNALQQGNIDAANILMYYYERPCCGDEASTFTNSYQFEKMLFIRNDLKNIYSRTIENDYSKPDSVRYIFRNDLSQQDIFKMWFELAQMYESGIGIPQNPVLAYVWYALLNDNNQASANEKMQSIQLQLSSEQQLEADKILTSHRDVYRFYPITY